MDICILDLETYWSVTHSLTKMSPIAYVMHPETELISMAYKFIRDDGPEETQVIFGDQAIKDFCAKTDWSNMWVVAHNNEGFDSMLCAWRLGIQPKMWGCTLAMARPHHAKTTGGSLAALVKHCGLGEKNITALVNTKGKHLKDFTPEEIEAMRAYNKADTDQCYGLFLKLAPKTPPDELRLIDMTIRALVEPQFWVDTVLLQETLDTEQARKRESLIALATKLDNNPDHTTEADIEEAVRTQLASAAKFAKFLRSRDVEPPMKPSPTNPNKTTYALSKTDEAFLALRDHEDELVAAAARMRLDVKSTLLETRIQSFLDAASATGGKLPVPLKYYGADTTGRWSGWAYNPQNLPRVPRDKEGNIIDKPSNALRLCMRAPKGYKVVVADLSGIELRVNHFLWKVPSSMALFQNDPEKADLYKDFASRLYGVPIDQVTKAQRQVGKVAHLGLGFGAGAHTFQKVAKLMGGVNLSFEESQDVVTKWRDAYPEIIQGWKTCHGALAVISVGANGYALDPWGLCVPVADGIKTPRGMIRYPNLRQEIGDDGKSEWVYGGGNKKARIYAGKIDENIVQHLARCIIADNALSVKKDTGYNPALMVHDELVYICPNSEAENLLNIVQSVMRTPPIWWPQLITWSEGGIAGTYGASK